MFVVPVLFDGPRLTVVSLSDVVAPAEKIVMSPVVPSAPAEMFRFWSSSVVMSICPVASEPKTLCPSMNNDPGPMCAECH